MRDSEISALPQTAANTLAGLRARAPRVHCITNTVAQAFTANALLAAGAMPSMTISPEEIEPFVARANTLLVNLGTFDRERREAVERAVETASKQRMGWILDPVLIDRSPPRADFARALLERKPAALRLNGAEFLALGGGKVDRLAAGAFARDHGVTVALSGETDFVADGRRLAAVANGHALMGKVTAMGCAASALAAACLAVEPDAWRASASALLIVNIAGEIAAERAKGPGSFAVAILDALASLDGPTLMKRAKVA